MRVFLVGLAAISMGLGARGGPGARPDEQTDVQKKVQEHNVAEAKANSDAAKAKVLAQLDSPEVRKDIAGLPCAKEKAETLLEMMSAEIDQMQFVHTFDWDPNTGTIKGKACLEEAVKVGFLPQLWERLSMGLTQVTDPKALQRMETQETKGLNFPPMQNPSKPAFTNAQNRPVYTAVNIWKRQAGNIEYGNITLVYDRWKHNNTAYIIPVDAGFWYDNCGFPKAESEGEGEAVARAPHCNVWDGKSFGSTEHYLHMILPHLGYWGLTLGQLLQRWYGNKPVPSPSRDLFWEADLAAAWLLPEHLLYGVVNYVMWGTKDGNSTRNAFITYKRPLAWAKDDDSGLFLDALVDAIDGNYTVTAKDKQDVVEHWAKKVAFDTLLQTINPGLRLHLMGYYTAPLCSRAHCANCRFLGTNHENPKKCLYWNH